MLLAQQAGQAAFAEMITNRFFKVFRVAVTESAVKAILATETCRLITPKNCSRRRRYRLDLSLKLHHSAIG